MKKALSLCLALVMILSLLAGCGQKDNKEPDPPTPPVSNNEQNPGDNQQTPPPSGDPVYVDADAASMTGTVRFYTAFGGANGTDALIAEFNSYYPNVKVEYEVYKNNADGNVAADTSMMAGNVDGIGRAHV